MSEFPPEARTWCHNPGAMAAWVPSIAGQLSFSMMGEGLSGCLHVTGMLSKDERVVIATQTRIATDAPIPGYINRASWSVADFLMVAHTASANRTRPNAETSTRDVQGVLLGSLFLLQQHRDPSQRQRRARLRGRIRRILGRFRDLEKLPQVLDKINASVVGARANGLGAGERGLEIPQAHFALFRSGEFRLWFLKNTLPARFRNKDGSLASENDVDAMRERFQSELGPHFYYFVRDMAHRHYHHAKTSDSLLPVVAVEQYDDVTWRRETTYSLARAVLEARRDDDLLHYKRAAGIAAYAAAFQDGLGKVQRSSRDFDIEESNPQALTYDWAHLLASMEARTSQQIWRHGSRVQAFAVILSACLATVALWFSIAQVDTKLGLTTDFTANNPPLLITIARILYATPIIFLFWISVIIFVGYEFFGRGFRSLSGVESYSVALKRLGYAFAVATSFRVRRAFPVAADTFGAFVGGSILIVVAGLAFDLSWAFAHQNIGQSWFVSSVMDIWERASAFIARL
jgi:hypothetical protein